MLINKTNLDLNLDCELEDLKTHINACFSDSDFNIKTGGFKNSGEIIIESKVFGTTEIPILPVALRLDIYLSKTKESNKYNAILVTNYLDIIGTNIILATIIILTLSLSSLDIFDIIFATIISLGLFIFPIYRLKEIRANRQILIDLLKNVEEACQIGNEINSFNHK